MARSAFSKQAVGFPWIIKDPNATLDYTIDWSAWLGDDTLSAVSWNVPSGLTKASEGFTATTATVWLSGGAVNKSFVVTCSITSTAGRIEDRSFEIRGQQR